MNQKRLSQSLYKADIQHDGFTFFVEEKYLFLGLCGYNYELYVTMPASISPSDANTLSVVLVDTLIKDINDLMHCKPLSF